MLTQITAIAYSACLQLSYHHGLGRHYCEHHYTIEVDRQSLLTTRYSLHRHLPRPGPYKMGIHLSDVLHPHPPVRTNLCQSLHTHSTREDETSLEIFPLGPTFLTNGFQRRYSLHPSRRMRNRHACHCKVGLPDS